MNISDWLIIVAVILGPILAVQVQKLIEKWQEQKKNKLWIFKTLMATRGTPLSPAHVQALNMIDLEFSKKSGEQPVLDAWKVYLDHLCDAPRDYQDPNYQTNFSVWCAKSNDCLIELLFTMGQSLGYEFDKVQLKKGAYTPKGHSDLELEQSLLRRFLLELLSRQRTIPVEVISQEQQTIDKQNK